MHVFHQLLLAGQSASLWCLFLRYDRNGSRLGGAFINGMEGLLEKGVWSYDDAIGTLLTAVFAAILTSNILTVLHFACVFSRIRALRLLNVLIWSFVTYCVFHALDREAFFVSSIPFLLFTTLHFTTHRRHPKSNPTLH